MNLVSLSVAGSSPLAACLSVFPPRRPSPQRSRTALSVGLLTLLLGWGNGAMPAQADSFTAPKRGYPDSGMTQGGGTRNPRTACVDPQGLALAPLIPHSAMALTQAAYPRFFWYVPETQARWAEFRLFSVVQNGDRLWDDTLIYQTEFKIDGEAGIASLQLPSTLNLPPLVEGQPYRWYVSLLCDPNDPIHNITVKGWVERSPLNPEQYQALAQTPEGDRALFFAQEGLWFDTLATLADLHCQVEQGEGAAEPENLWRELLSDEDVDLMQLSQVPFLAPCSTATAPDVRVQPATIAQGMQLRFERF